ncbi:MAG: prolyl oligopeptidase family serine peptidase [Spirosomataceae bacterium]
MKHIAIVLTLLLLVFNAIAQDNWTSEEIINTESVSSPTFSPSGKMILWSKKEGVKKEDKFVSKLFLTRLDVQKEGKPLTVQLTQGETSERNAIFSKDGREIYFLSSRDKGKKLWKLSIYGGEPEEIYEFKNGISSVKWLDSTTVAFLSNEGKSLYDLNNEEVKDDTEIIEDSLHWNPTRVYAFDLKTKEIKRLSVENQEVEEYDISENGQYLITKRMTSLHHHTDGKLNPICTFYDLKNGTRSTVLNEINEPGNLTFAPDNSGFYFTAKTSSVPQWDGAGKNELYFYNLIKKGVVKVSLNSDWGMNNSIEFANDLVLADLANGAYQKTGLYRKTDSGWDKIEVDFGMSDKHVNARAMSKDGKKLLFEYSTASQLPEFYVADIPEATSNKLTVINVTEWISLNDKLKKKTIAKTKVIYWKGADDVEINGILYYPKNYEAGKKYPLILSIHGGPTGVDQDQWSERWSTYPQIYTDKGAFVLKPNYQGSGSHGQEFAEAIKLGNYYTKNQIDLYNSIQYLDEKGLIDMDKLGVMGWSNGAILATWMTLKYPDMFKVAAPGAGDVNWTSDYGTCSFGVTFDQYYLGGAPWDDVNGKNYNETYITYSPLFDIEKIKTPTIIFHGSEDRSVPRDQGWEYFRGLQQVGKAPVKFLWFPGQPHGLQKITHQLRKMKEEIDWIDTYLFNTPNTDNEAFKKESPLDYALQKAKLSKQKGVYGIIKNNALIPEFAAVKKDSIQLSVFELTNAQFAAYDKKYEFEAVKSNYPATNLTVSQINGYVTWLNKTTGETYRLPNEKEAEALHKKAIKNADKENTLNAWAGYEITLEDAQKLMTKLTEESLDLTKEVGSFNPIKIGKAAVYDLCGNVAEYFKDGNDLKIYGYDAHTFVDALNVKSNDSKKIGVRLMKE